MAYIGYQLTIFEKVVALQNGLALKRLLTSYKNPVYFLFRTDESYGATYFQQNIMTVV